MGTRQVPELGDRCLRTFFPSTMAGKPFKVGRFAHTLRVRLMREHLGVDVDGMYEEDLMAAKPQKPQYDQQTWDPDQEENNRSDVTHVKTKKSTLGVGGAAMEGMHPRVRVTAFSTDISTTRSCWRCGGHRSHQRW